MKYLSVSDYLKNTYNTKVYKLSLQSGCTCPNRDGTISRGGCTFCSEGGSGEYAAPFLAVGDQIKIAREKVDKKISNNIPPEKRRYIAYFQSYTNTYGNVERLKCLYKEAINEEQVVILSIGTRPDCLSEEMIDMLRELNSIKPVWVELGLQTIHEETAIRINRGYELDVFEKSYQKLKAAGLTVIVHTILYLPGEGEDDILETIKYLADLSPGLDGIKLQGLQVLKGTKIGEEYLKEHFYVPSLEEYADTIVKCLRIIPEGVVVHRITGDGPKNLLIEPKWSANKKLVLNTLKTRIDKAV